LHRDIKPDNILWEPETDEAVLGDLGIAIAADQASRGAGTRGYIAPEVYRGAASPQSDVFSLGATLLPLVTGERPRENTPSTGHAGWASIPEELRQVLLAGLNPDAEGRPAPATFLALLRETRWKALTDQIMTAVPSVPGPVKLQASVEVANADQPTVFRPLFRAGRPEPAATGDYVKVEAQATADGYITVLVLGSAGDVEVGLPCPTEPENLFRARQNCTLIFQLTPPAGTERLLIHSSVKSARRTPLQWQQWLERNGLTHEEAEAANQARLKRGAELVRVQKGATPEGQRRVLVIPVPHVMPN
jgi:serine/threonine protein kinase